MSTKKNNDTNIYLDNNATTPLCEEVRKALIEASYVYGNPSSIHTLGQQARAELVLSRKKIAEFLSIRQDELIFTSSATEALNLLIRGLVDKNPKGHVITSNIEHAAVYETLKLLEQEGVKVTFLACNEEGKITQDAVKQALSPSTSLIVIASVNSETGVKNDVHAIAKLAKETSIPFVVDAVGQFGKELFTIDEGISALCFTGHKIHAPKGVGALFLRRGLKLSPYMTGGHQEFSKRAGTENTWGISAFAKAVELLGVALPEATRKMQDLRDYFENELKSTLDCVEVNGGVHRICNTSNLCFHGVEGELLLRLLDLQGVCASHGSACSSGAIEPSRVLLNMGLGMKRAGSSLRFSLSRFTTKQEIDHALEIIIETVKKIK